MQTGTWTTVLHGFYKVCGQNGQKLNIHGFPIDTSLPAALFPSQIDLAFDECGLLVSYQINNTFNTDCQ